VARRRPYAVSTFLASLGVIMWLIVGLRFVHRAEVGLPLDFQVYRDAAISMLHGRATYSQRFTRVHLHYTYPPFALLLMSVFGVLPAPVALALWSICSAAALVAFVAIALNALVKLPRGVIITGAFALSGASCLLLQPLRSSLEFGQINFLLMLAVIVDLVLLRSSSRGVLTGMAAAIKLTPLIYVAYFAINRARTSVARAICTFVAAAGVAWLVLPADSTLYWFHQAFSPGRKGRSFGSINQSWFGFAGELFPNSHVRALALWLVLSIVTIAAGVLLAKHYLKQSKPIEALLCLALSEVLVSPISWAHHWSWIILVPVLLITMGRRDRLILAAMTLVLVVGFFSPYKWHHLRGWEAHDPLSLMLNFSLLFSGALLFVAMAVTAFAKRSTPLPPLGGHEEVSSCDALSSSGQPPPSV
jgi:alpha-1,2-mannosyltransferase